jgi:hypothetical protein
MKNLLHWLVLGILELVLAPLYAQENCIATGKVVVEDCGCKNKYGGSATRVCREYTPLVTGSGYCSTLCEQCECSSDYPGYSGNRPSSNNKGGFAGVPAEPARTQAPQAPSIVLPKTIPRVTSPVTLRFCIGEQRNECAQDISWQGCPQHTGLGATDMANRLCRLVNRPPPPPSAISTTGVFGGHKCGYTYFSVTCPPSVVAVPRSGDLPSREGRPQIQNNGGVNGGTIIMRPPRN